jgi:uncharacterized protein YggE
MALTRRIDTFARMITSRAFIVVPLAVMLLAMPGACRPSAAATDGPTTQLTLSVTGQATHAPDATIATLSVQQNAKTAVAAQSGVNSIMTSALAATHTVAGLRATTGSYSVYPADQKQTGWQAQQSLDLHLTASPESDAASQMRHLIGMLQGKGVLLESIAGTLAPTTARQTRTAAIKDAVAQMRAEADAAAAALGDHVVSITKIDLTTQTPFRPRFMALRMAAKAEPQLQSGPMTEQITLSATVNLGTSSQ